MEDKRHKKLKTYKSNDYTISLNQNMELNNVKACTHVHAEASRFSNGLGRVAGAFSLLGCLIEAPPPGRGVNPFKLLGVRDKAPPGWAHASDMSFLGACAMCQCILDAHCVLSTAAASNPQFPRAGARVGRRGGLCGVAGHALQALHVSHCQGWARAPGS